MHVDQAADVEGLGDLRRVLLDHVDDAYGQRGGRDHARTVARVHTGLFDVFHDAADEHLAGVVAQRVDVHLDGVFQETVDQHRPLGRQAAFFAQ